MAPNDKWCGAKVIFGSALISLGTAACSSEASSESGRSMEHDAPGQPDDSAADAVDDSAASETDGESADEQNGRVEDAAMGPDEGGGADRMDESNSPNDDAGDVTEYVVPGAFCESSADCHFEPGSWSYHSVGTCAPTDCGEPTCQDFVPCAAPSQPALLCSCDREVVGGSVGCDAIRNYAFAMEAPFPDTTFDDGCGDEPPEQWSVRLEVTGWEEHDGKQLTITGPITDGALRVTVEGGAVSMPIDARVPTWETLLLFFDANADDSCNDGELSFDTVSSGDAITGEVVVSPVAEGTTCD